MGLPIIDTILSVAEKAADKIWMDKDKKEQLNFDKEKFVGDMKLAIQGMEQKGELDELEIMFKEAQAQRDYAQQQFGTAQILKDFFTGRIILLGRAAIRWVITGFAMWQAHRLVTLLLTSDVIKAFAAGTLSGASVWVISLLVCMIIGIPLFYVTGVTIEKLMKARGII